MNRITKEEYATAVATCVELAKQPTGGGRVAAQVLLSAYNGDSFQLNVTDLCNLDNGNYTHALAVIRGRYEVSREPQEMIPDGSNVFRALWAQWARLELTERAKKRCPDCDGGKIYKNEDDEIGVVCSRCAGTGRVCGCE
jgi:hypothetical protein